MFYLTLKATLTSSIQSSTQKHWSSFLISYGYANYTAQIKVPALTKINYYYFMLAKDHLKEEQEYQYRHIDTSTQANVEAMLT